MIFEQNKDLKAAAEAYQRALTKNSYHAKSLNGLGRMYLKEKSFKNLKRARYCFEESLKIEEDSDAL